MSLRRRRGGGWLIPAFVLCFYAGITAGWWLHGRSTPERPLASSEPVELPIPTTRDDRTPPEPAAAHGERPGSAGDAAAAATTRMEADPVAELRNHRLRVPIDGARIDVMKGGFAERRDGGGRPHEAVDILAPRNTPIRAAEAGTIARLFTSKAGGLTIYQFDKTQRFCYYYAHLERYADGLREGQQVAAGDVIGFVGTSGNAPPSTPHLHFAIFELTADRRWWEGKAIDPFLVFSREERRS